MKKLLTLLLFIAAFGLTALQAQTTRQYADTDMNQLLLDLENAVDGDIFELSTSGGMYPVDTMSMEIHADITIRATDGLAEKPIVKHVDDQGVDYIIRLKGADLTVLLEGLVLEGNGSNTKYAIRTAKVGDISDFSGYRDASYDGSVEQLYDLTIMDCEISGIKDGSDGRGIIMYPGTRARLLKVENSIFTGIERDGIDAYLSSDDIAASGYWQFADSIAVVNSTFHHVGREAIQITTNDDDISKSNVLFVNHVTFDSCAWNNSDPGKYHTLKIDYVDATITNSIFTDDVSDDYITRIYHPEAHANYIGVNNLGEGAMADTIKTSNGAVMGDSLWAGNPLYRDALNGDYTLDLASPFLGLATDKTALGDARWDPNEVPVDNADLLSISVGGEKIEGFHPNTLSYDVVLQAGTTEVPATTAMTSSQAATTMVTDAASLPGTTTIVVTAEDGTTEKTYTLNLSVVVIDNAKLSGISVGGEELADFDPAVLDYTVELSAGTTDAPEVIATAQSAAATALVTPAAALPGTTSILVTAEDGITTLTYTVEFTLEQDNADLASISVDGEEIPRFDSEELDYLVKLPYGTTVVPTVTAMAVSPGATVLITPATALPGTTTILVTADDGVTTLTYNVEFKVLPLASTRQYTADDMGLLLADLENAVEGDVFELTTSGGIYKIDSMSVNIWESITIKAADGLDMKPVFQLTDNEYRDVDYIVRLRGEDISVYLEGLILQGDGANTKYGIRTAKIGDFNPDWKDGDYLNPAYDGSVVQYYDLHMNECEVKGIKSGSDGRGIIAYPGTRGRLIKIENCIFTDIERDAFDAYTDTDDLNGRGHWQFVDSMAVLNTTFHHVGREAIQFRTADTSNTSGLNVLFIDHVTFDSCAWNNSDPGKYHTLKIDYVDVTITNSVFTNDISDDYITRIYHPNASADYIGVFKLGLVDPSTGLPNDTIYMADTIKTSNGATVGDNMWDGDPLYADAANGDYTMGLTSPFLAKASDGWALGDLRWDPTKVAGNNANLSGITIGGTTMEGFTMDKLDYSVGLHPSTVGVPEVMASTESPDATTDITQASSLPGTATIVVTAEDGVTIKTYTVFLFIDDELSSELSELASLNIYPNPSNGQFTITNAEGSNVKIYSISGAMIYQRSNISGNQLISTNLEKGLYLVRIDLKGKQHISKITVE